MRPPTQFYITSRLFVVYCELISPSNIVLRQQEELLCVHRKLVSIVSIGFFKRRSFKNINHLVVQLA